jgi:Kef-type K+ transport system membrane component KefB
MGNRALQRRLRVVAFAMITPFFFINGGMNVSLPLLAANLGLLVQLLLVKQVTKVLGTYPFARAFAPRDAMYATLLMSTGLTMGTISSMFGYNAGIINQVQFSALVAVVVLSAMLPTFVAQKWFQPAYEVINGQEVKAAALEPARKVAQGQIR